MKREQWASSKRRRHQDPAVWEAKYERRRACISTGGANARFEPEFLSLELGDSCRVCNRLWYNSNLSTLNSVRSVEKRGQGLCVLRDIFPDASDHAEMRLCRTCRESVLRGRVPQFSVTKGFKYPPKPAHLPRLKEVKERMISPRILFMNIRRLTHGYGQSGIRGQVDKRSHRRSTNTGVAIKGLSLHSAAQDLKQRRWVIAGANYG